MRRSPWLMMMLAALLVWWAARVVPQALGFSAATVTFTGNVETGGANPVVYCRPPAFPGGVPRGATTTGTLTCWNNMNVAITVNVAAATVTPTFRPPTIRWGAANPGSTATTIVVPAGTSGTATMRVTPPNNTFAGITYTATFTTAVTGSNGLDYSKTHSVSLLMQ